MQITPNIRAVSTLVNARRHVGFCWHGADARITQALWSLLWELSGEELGAAMLLVNLDNMRAMERGEFR